MQGATVLIRVTIEVVPRGIEAHKHEIGRLEIENTAGDEYTTDHTADYHVRAMISRANGDVAQHHRTILAHPRRSLNALGLVMSALVALGYDPMKASEDVEQPDLER